MRDIWGVLFQTLNVSGVAVLLLVLKALFRDKLTPRWQAAVWLVLLIPLLLPAGWNGRSMLFDWRLWVESLRTAVTGGYGTLVTVTAPVPLPPVGLPQTPADGLFLLYVAGVMVCLLRDAAAWLRLRSCLVGSRVEESEAVQRTAERYGLRSCPVRRVENLPYPFLFGVVRPVLVLPAGEDPDEKVLLHELLHLRCHDAVWGLVIGVFRCLHWCNPLLRFCAEQAANDVEALCDQRVLERLEGEARREYGKILLDMVDNRHARCPGTSCIANGGRNIRHRIEAIVRFRLYPAGMGLVSLCLILVLAVPLAAGVRTENLRTGLGPTVAMASARTLGCTTVAGALDTCARALLQRNALTMSVCAPLAEQEQLAERYLQTGDADGNGSLEESDLAPVRYEGYRVLNLHETGKAGVWEALLVFLANRRPEPGKGNITLLCQPVQVEKEGERWVCSLGERTAVDSFDAVFGTFPVGGLPAEKRYRGICGDFILEMQLQTCSFLPESEEEKGAWKQTLHPDGVFQSRIGWGLQAEYAGDPAGKGDCRSLEVSVRPFRGEEPGDVEVPAPWGDGSALGSGTSSDGSAWTRVSLRENWESPVFLVGGGYGEGSSAPDGYQVLFSVNGQPEIPAVLRPVEGGTAG